MAQATTTEVEEQEEFRTRVRKWLKENASPRRERTEEEEEDSRPEAFDFDDDAVVRAQRFQAKLHDAGFAGITWPTEYGGQGLTMRHQLAFNHEASAFELPNNIFTIGLGMCAPTILAHGTEEQKQRYVRPLIRGEEIWCQLFSEPGAGSDVASLQTKAVRDGDDWILTGQKVWTSGAQRSDYGAIIARTNPDVPKHQGITMFIVDMKAPSVEVRPLRQITGDASFTEVFFNDVRVPGENVIGEVDKGWGAAITMLMNERVAIGAGGGGGRRTGADALIRLARDRGILDDPRIRQKIVEVFIDQRILGYVGRRIQQAVRAGRPPGPEGSIAKLAGALLAKKSADVGMLVAGPSGAAWEAEDRRGSRWATLVLGAPASAIAGGTNEIMRNIIGERVLELPKEPQVDRDVPFRELKVGTQK